MPLPVQALLSLQLLPMLAACFPQAPVVVLHVATLQLSAWAEQSLFAVPTQVPALLQLEAVVQGLPSSQAVPLLIWALQVSAASSQTPVLQGAAVKALQSRAVPAPAPTPHRPAAHFSPTEQYLPSSQATPSLFFVTQPTPAWQMPVEHGAVPKALQLVAAPAPQTPAALQVSPVVQGSPSSHALAVRMVQAVVDFVGSHSSHWFAGFLLPASTHTELPITQKPAFTVFTHPAIPPQVAVTQPSPPLEQSASPPSSVWPLQLSSAPLHDSTAGTLALQSESAPALHSRVAVQVPLALALLHVVEGSAQKVLQSHFLSSFRHCLKGLPWMLPQV